MKSTNLKLAVLSDLHLTNSLPHTIIGDTHRMICLVEFLKYFFKEIRRKKADFLIIPGDVCHRSSLGPDDLWLLMTFLNLILESGIEAIVCNGNHDLDSEKSILSFLEDKSFSEKIIIDNSNNSIEVHAFLAETFFRSINFCNHHTFLEESSKEIPIEYKHKILIGHVGVKGTLHGSTKSIVGVLGEDIEKLGKMYDLIILGHHHKFQMITEKAFYAGAIQQTRADEVDTVPGGLFVTLSDKIEIEHIENKFSPRFIIIEDYIFNPREIENSIVKVVLDTEGKSELENKDFLLKIQEAYPYKLIPPNTRRTFKPKTSLISDSSSRIDAVKEAIRGMKPLKEKKIEFVKNTIDIYNQVERGE